jgi:hypothetical protein
MKGGAHAGRDHVSDLVLLDEQLASMKGGAHARRDTGLIGLVACRRGGRVHAAP